MVLWDRAFREVAAEYPDIATESLLVDAAAMNFIRRPETFDVVVGSNLFGDILSDISAIIVGSMGLAASANLDPSRRFPSMFEPVHGSAPDIAGKGIVNPLATILSAGHDAGSPGNGATPRAKWKPPWPRCWPRAACARRTWAAAPAPKTSPPPCWRNWASGAHRPARLSGRRGHPAEPHRRPGPPARLRTLLRPLRRGRRLQRRLPHPQLPAEPVRRGRALRLLHPRLRAPAGRRATRKRPAASPARSATILALATSALVLLRECSPRRI